MWAQFVLICKKCNPFQFIPRRRAGSSNKKPTGNNMPRNARVSRQQQAFEALLDEDFQDGEPGTARSTTTGQRRNGKGASRRERADGGFRFRCDAERQRQVDEHKADLEHLLELYGDRYDIWLKMM